MSFAISLVACACAMLAVVLLFDLLNFDHDEPGIHIKEQISKQLDKQLLSNDESQSLEGKINDLTGKKPMYLVRQINEARDILNDTNRGSEYRKTVVSCIALAAVGCVIGIAVQNIILIPVLAFFLFMVPIWRLKKYKITHKRYLNQQLESGLSLVTAAYVRSNNLIQSVEENINSFSPLIKPAFAEFLAEYKVDPNLPKCIRNMRRKINEPIFQEWCDAVIKAYENATMKETLLPIVSKYTTQKTVQDELDAETSATVMNYVVMMVAIPFMFLLVRFALPQWFDYYSYFGGKIVIALAVLTLVYAISRLVVFMMPVEFKR